MKKWLKISNRRFYASLVIFSALVGLIPVIILGVFAAARSSAQLKEALFQADEDYLSSCRTRMEDMMEAAENYYAYSGIQDEILQFSFKDLNFQDYSGMKQIRQFLRGGQYFQEAIDKVYLVNFKYSYVVGVSEAGYYETPEEDNVLLQTMLKQEEEKQTIFWEYIPDWEGLRQKGISGSYSAQGFCLFVKLPMYISSRQAAIVVSFSSQELTSLFLDGRGQAPLLLISEDGTVLYSQDSQQIGQTYQTISEMTDLAMNGEYGVSRQGSVYVSHMRGHNGMTYVKMTSAAQVERAVREIYGVVALLCTGILIALACMIIVISRRLYGPVQKVYDRAKALVKGTNTGAGELEVIERGLAQLSDENTQLQEQMNENVPQLQELFLMKLLRGSLSEEEQQSYIAAIPEKTDWKVMKLAAVWYQRSEQSGALGDYSRIFMSQLVNQVIPEEERWPIVYFERRLVVLIRDDAGDNPQPKMTHWAEEIMRRAEELAEIKVNIGISGPFESFGQASRAYRESSNALMYKTFYGQEMIVYTGPKEAEEKAGYPREKARDLHYTIQNCNEEAARKLVEEITREIFGRWRAPMEYRLYIMRLAADILGAVDELGDEYQAIYPELALIYEKIGDLHEADSANRFLYEQMILPIISYLQKARSQHQNQAAEQLMEKIKAQYDTDLTLEICADELHYHTMYLWQIFKDRYGITFAQCLDNVRFQKAKEWLASTELPVAEIASRLRYSNAQNFIRSFKKKEGMTPGQYRDRHGKIQ